jgi:putative transposase
MDNKGAWRDNVFLERFWRTMQYEEIYLHAYEGVGEARQPIGRFIAFYNARRPHAVLYGRTPIKLLPTAAATQPNPGR